MRSALSLVVILTLSVVLLSQWMKLLRVTARNVNQIINTTEEQRKGRTYDQLGYTYISRILSNLPEPSVFPVTRYTNYTRNIDSFFPIHITRIDPRIIIGIQIPQQDLHETLITNARRENGYWAFHTTDDYDTLSAIHFTLDTEIPPKETKVTLYKDASRQTILGSWASYGSILQLPSPIHRFSFTRGSRDFLLMVEPSENITGIEVYGIKVDLDGYVVIDREGDTFTAIQKSFLTDIEKNNKTDWIEFLSKMNIPML